MKRVTDSKLRAILRAERRTPGDLQKLAAELQWSRRVITLARQLIHAHYAECQTYDEMDEAIEAEEQAREALRAALAES